MTSKTKRYIVGLSNGVQMHFGLHPLVTPLGNLKLTERFRTSCGLQYVWLCQCSHQLVQTKRPLDAFGKACNQSEQVNSLCSTEHRKNDIFV